VLVSFVHYVAPLGQPGSFGFSPRC